MVITFSEKVESSEVEDRGEGYVEDREEDSNPITIPSPPDSPVLRPWRYRIMVPNLIVNDHRERLDPLPSPRQTVDHARTISEIIDEMVENGELIPRPPTLSSSEQQHQEQPEQQQEDIHTPIPRRNPNPLRHSRPPPPSPIHPRRRRLTQRELDDIFDVDEDGVFINFMDANGRPFVYSTSIFPII